MMELNATSQWQPNCARREKAVKVSLIKKVTSNRSTDVVAATGTLVTAAPLHRYRYDGPFVPHQNERSQGKAITLLQLVR